MMACSSAGQLCQDGSCGWQRRMLPVRSGLEADDDGSAPALDAARPRPRSAAGTARAPDARPRAVAAGSRCTRRIDSIQFVEPEGHARQHVAVPLDAALHVEFVGYGAHGASSAQVERLRRWRARRGRRARARPRVRASPCRRRRSGRARRCARRRCRAGPALPRRARSMHSAIAAAPAGSEVVARAARHDEVEQVALAEAPAALARSRCSLRRKNCARPKAKPASLPSAPRSPRWLAMRSSSSASARSHAARARHAHAGHALERLAVGPREGHARSRPTPAPRAGVPRGSAAR